MANCDSSLLPEDAFVPPGGGGGGSLFASDLLWINGTQSEVIDGASAVAFDFDTDNAYALGDLFSFKNNGTSILDLGSTLVDGLKFGPNTTQDAINLYYDNNIAHIELGRIGVAASLDISSGNSSASIKHSANTSMSVIFDQTVGIGTQGFFALYSQNSASVENTFWCDHNTVRNRDGNDARFIGGMAQDSGAVDRDGGDIIFERGPAANAGLKGQIIFEDLPTADPLVAGAIWNDSGTIKISP